MLTQEKLTIIGPILGIFLLLVLATTGCSAAGLSDVAVSETATPAADTTGTPAGDGQTPPGGFSGASGNITSPMDGGRDGAIGGDPADMEAMQAFCSSLLEYDADGDGVLSETEFANGWAAAYDGSQLTFCDRDGDGAVSDAEIQMVMEMVNNQFRNGMSGGIPGEPPAEQ